MPREHYVEQLERLQDNVLEMGSMVDRQIERALEALLNRDIALAEAVARDDRMINQARYDIDTDCLALMAQQAPLASDLRLVVSVLSIVTDLERMGDHAEGIARIVILMQDEPLVKPLVDIPLMAKHARAMTRDALDAFVGDDVEAAYAVGRADDIVDSLQDTVYLDLLKIMIADPTTIEACTHLLWVAHNLERIADRATNIAERTVFAVSGTLPEMDVSAY